MSLQNESQLENTRKKLGELENLYTSAQNDATMTDSVRQVTLNSLRKTINRMKEEITRYVSRQTTSSEKA